jgi:exopolyphosphatase/guanosine-5'-triphosphate,3'-diphosphate pyrophosphatase
MNLPNKCKIALFDLGSSALKLQIVEVNDENYRSIFSQKSETALNRGMDEKGMISEATIDLVADTFINCKKLVDEHAVYASYIIATEALRKAKNKEALISRIAEIMHIGVHIVTQEQEAKLFWLATTRDLKSEYKAPLITFDIGGGSVQICYGTKEKPSKIFTFPTGAVVLFDKFIKHDPCLKEEFKQLKDFIIQQLDPVDFQGTKESIIIHGSSSIVTFYKEVGFNLDACQYSNSEQHQSKITETQRMLDKILALPLEARRNLFPSRPTFMDMACIGLTYVTALAEKFNINFEVPTNKSIMDGIMHVIQTDSLEKFLNEK